MIEILFMVIGAMSLLVIAVMWWAVLGNRIQHDLESERELTKVARDPEPVGYFGDEAKKAAKPRRPRSPRKRAPSPTLDVQPIVHAPLKGRKDH